jgi:hypothetical protein
VTCTARSDDGAEWLGGSPGWKHGAGRPYSCWAAVEAAAEEFWTIAEHVTGPGEDGAGAGVDETDVKKGTGTVYVKRKYTDVAGRVENGQVAVHRADQLLAVPGWLHTAEKFTTLYAPLGMSVKPRTVGMTVRFGGAAIGCGPQTPAGAGVQIFSLSPVVR